ncbi:E3 ubiquitin-protein ligase RNF13-like [Lepeophtheirus salmonis]|uniref:E3 ubiquitin-protein ligase RNF13-like n=1 Tax=Lepeophtheirus salmonis TaxID=72036 RepID=UPI001AE81BB2|nr:E3 ubiquitin-protein ligase RNF13-like [Lepeophtheirus salmonis]
MRKYCVSLLLLVMGWMNPTRSEVVIRYSTPKGHVTMRMESAEASFGLSIPLEGLMGRVRKGQPLDGCTAIEEAPNRQEEDPLWFVILVRSSNCTFSEKVKAATKGNYSGAIIYNNNSDKVLHMGGTGSYLTPSVFIGLTDGEVILHKYLYYQSANASVTLYPDDPFDLNVYLLPFAIVIGICFLLMLGIVIFKCVQDHRRNRRHRLPKSALKNLPIIRYNEESSPYDTCCICLDDYINNDKLRILPCDHAYHKNCIDPWLVKNRRICPQCRKKVFCQGQEDTDEEETTTERDSLLSNVRSITINGGTFHAGGTYAAALAEQVSHNSRRNFRTRFNLFSRYRRLEDNYLDNESLGQTSSNESSPEYQTPPEYQRPPTETTDVMHVAIVHSQDSSSSSSESENDGISRSRTTESEIVT